MWVYNSMWESCEWVGRLVGWWVAQLVWLFSILVIAPRPCDASKWVEGTSRLIHDGEEGRWALVAPRMRSEEARLSLNIDWRASPTANPLSISNWASSASESGRHGRSASGTYTRCATGRVLIAESIDESVTRWELLLPVFSFYSTSLYTTQLYAIILSLYLLITSYTCRLLPGCRSVSEAEFHYTNV